MCGHPPGQGARHRPGDRRCGIRTAADAREYLAAGAVLVAIGTAALAEPRVPERIARELTRG